MKETTTVLSNFPPDEDELAVLDLSGLSVPKMRELITECKEALRELEGQKRDVLPRDERRAQWFTQVGWQRLLGRLQAEQATRSRNLLGARLKCLSQMQHPQEEEQAPASETEEAEEVQP